MSEQDVISKPEAQALVSLVQSERHALQRQGLTYRQAYEQALREVGATKERYRAAMRMFGRMGGGRRKKQEAAQPALLDTLKTQIDAVAQAAKVPGRNYSDLYEQCLGILGWVPDDPAFIILTGCGKSTPSVIRNSARQKGWIIAKKDNVWIAMAKPKSEKERRRDELNTQIAAIEAEAAARVAAKRAELAELSS